MRVRSYHELKRTIFTVDIKTNETIKTDFKSNKFSKKGGSLMSNVVVVVPAVFQCAYCIHTLDGTPCTCHRRRHRRRCHRHHYRFCMCVSLSAQVSTTRQTN